MKKILTLILFMGIALTAYTQGGLSNIKLGVQASPTFSWMNTNDNQITADGTNLGLNLGFMGQYYFSDNYSLVTGVSLLLNQGGGLKYNYDGNFLPRAAAERLLTDPTSQLDSISLGSVIRYGAQYIEIPIGIRLRTNEFGYLRYYAEMPIFTIGFRTQARGDISGLGIENENITSDVTPITFKWGLGGGVEYSVSPNFSLIGGLIYTSTLIDVTRDSDTAIYGPSNIQEDSKGNIHSITLRIGAIF